MPLDGRAIVEVDDVRAVRAGTRMRADGLDAGPHGHPVALQRRPDDVGVARVIGRREAGARLDDRRRDIEPGVDLGELAAGRTAAQDHQARWQLAGEGRLLVGPRPRLGEAIDRGDPRRRTHRDDDVRGAQLVVDAVVGDLDPATADDRGLPAIDGGACLREPVGVAGVVRFGGVGRAVDHVVAVRRGARPRVVVGVGLVLGRPVQERLRRQAADVRAAPADPAALDDSDSLAQGGGLEPGGLAARPGADDDEVKVVGFVVLVGHGVSLPRQCDDRVVAGLRTTAPRP